MSGEGCSTPGVAVSGFASPSPIAKAFAYHKPSEAGLARINQLRQAYSDLLTLIESVSAGREKAVAITNLETSAMWAIKGVVCNDPASEVSQ